MLELETTGTADVLELARSRMPGMSPAIQRVAEAVLGDPERMLSLSAARLAAVSDSSVGSVVRFCNELGFPGFQDFKLTLAAHVGPRPWPGPAAITDADPQQAVVEKLFATVIANLTATAGSIAADDLVRAAELVRGAHRILVVAAGTSQPLASDLASRLFGRGFPASYPADAQTQFEAATRLDRGDICFAISHSGTTTQTNEPVRASQSRGAFTIALTSFSASPLAHLADHVLVAGAPADTYRTADMASRLAHLMVINALWSLIRHQRQ